MSKIDKAATLAGIFAIAADIYDKYAARQRDRQLAERDQKIRELDERIVKLETKGA